MEAKRQEGKQWKRKGYWKRETTEELASGHATDDSPKSATRNQVLIACGHHNSTSLWHEIARGRDMGNLRRRWKRTLIVFSPPPNTRQCHHTAWKHLVPWDGALLPRDWGLSTCHSLPCIV
ncbi:hypothetical protein G6O67_005092 [Ophiocordyceps sinensis]|uniref:Uncharacterized protein n=1 Tax=Ophiocordyceps sinensis TaxID=72228 RepID=A0A8H4PQU9_9HYPO|nr:hypothetical protein G6O67_005092 [Ophiocordyceps sinensis]